MEQQGLILKASRSAALATLVRLLGDFDVAEEALQEASYRALVDWRENSLPENPVAWLVQAARRFAIDQIRHKNMSRRVHDQLEPVLDETALPDDELRVSTLHQYDDQLRLIFTCCHPELTLQAQVALTLKTVAGLSTEEIARCFLTPVSTLQRRLQRAKQKIRDMGIPYRVPEDTELEQRFDAVFRVIYLIYNQAYTALNGDELFDRALSEAAIYLARMLNRLVRNQPEAMGLLALMLFQHARVNARVDESGIPVPLEEQDRSKWDKSQITEANVLLQKSDRHWKPGPYQIQAAIAAVHCNAENAAATNWQEIVDLFEVLEDYSSGPVITLNKAVAMGFLLGAEQGLAMLNQLAEDPQMNEFQYFHSARAGLLEKMGDFSAACNTFERAIELCKNDAEVRYMKQKIRQLSN